VAAIKYLTPNPKSRLSTFYWIVVTQALSLLGSRMTSIAVGIWVFAQTGQTTPLLLTAFFTELPGMLAGSLAGVLVDRWPRKRLLVLADSGQAVGSLFLLVSFASGHFALWQLYAVSLLQGSFAILQGPAWQAAMTMLVSEAQRERANGIQEMGFPLAGVIAPVVAGFVYAWLGVTWVIGIDLASFVIAVAVLLAATIPQPEISLEASQVAGQPVQEFLAGFRFIFARRSLGIFLIYGVLTNFLLNGPLELAIPYLLSVTGSETLTGTLMGFMSLGALSGALLIAVWGGSRPRMLTILGGMLLNGLMFLIYGTVRHPILLGAVLFLIFFPLPISNALTNAIIQVKVPADLQGRIFAIIAQLSFLGSTTSFLLTGYLVDHVLEPAASSQSWELVGPLVGRGPGAGIGLLLVVTGLLMLAATTIMALIPSVRNLERLLADIPVRVEEALRVE